MGQMARAQGANYDLYTFITHPGAEGVAKGGQACNDNPIWRISMTKAYGDNQCNTFSPPNLIDCSRILNRITLTAEVSVN